MLVVPRSSSCLSGSHDICGKLARALFGSKTEGGVEQFWEHGQTKGKFSLDMTTCVDSLRNSGQPGR